MARVKLFRYIVKKNNGVFVDRDNEFTEEEKVVWDNFLNNFVYTLRGRDTNYIEVDYPDEHTKRIAMELGCPDDKERFFAESFMREMGTSNNQYRLAYVNMMKSRGEDVDPTKCYWSVEYSNNHTEIYKFGPAAANT